MKVKQLHISLIFPMPQNVNDTDLKHDLENIERVT